jgi:hypothetical protein
MQLTYSAEQDRLLLRLSTRDPAEFRFWLTRRCAKLLWRVLVKMVEQDRALQGQFDPGTRRQVLGIQHEGFVSQGNFSQTFDDNTPRSMPLGETPVLVTKLQTQKKPDGVQQLSLHPTQGQGIDMLLDTRLLHILCKLLRETVAKADWDIELQFAQEHAGEPAEARPQRLN